MERLEDLQVNGIKVYQDDELYHFTSDSILLTKFAKVKKDDIVADFCSGSGIVGFHIYALNTVIKSLTFFEMQKSLFDLSVKSIELNNFKDKFSAVNCRVQDIDCSFNEKFSLIVCNPPYMDIESGKGSEDECIRMCKSEVYLKLEELVFKASKCLKYGGRFDMVHRADRIAEIITVFKKYNLEPKKLQFVCGGNKEPYLLLIEGVKGGKTGVKVLNTIKN